MTDQIHALLHQIYDEAQAQTTYEALIHTLEKAPRPTSKREALYDERDILLITYGDSLQHPNQSPMQTLRAFAETHLRPLFSGIHILPFYPYTSDDGFSVSDFYAVNPSIGTWDDVRALGAHFDLMFDAVFNHMSAGSEWFARFLEDDPNYLGLFRTENPTTDLSAVTRPRTSPLLTPFIKANGETIHVWTTFSADQVDFDVHTPATLLRLIDVLLFYVSQGASFIRLDAIAFLWKEAGTSSIHLPQTHAIIQLMRAVLDVVAPHVVLITETNVPHKENISYWGDGANEAQMVYNFPLPPLLFYSLTAGNIAKLRDWIQTLHTPSDRTTFFNFTASHDGIGVRPVEGMLTADEVQLLADVVLARDGRVSYRRQTDGTDSPYELNITYVDALINPQDPPALQAKKFMVSQAVMLSLAGVPAVYIHSLVGSRNDIAGRERTGHNRTVNRAKLDADVLEAELTMPDSLRHHIFTAYADLLQKRRSLPAFHPNAPQHTVDMGNDAVLALRRGTGDEAVLAVFNFSDTPQTIAHPLTGDDVVSGEILHAVTVLAPYQICWLIGDSSIQK